MQKKISYVLVSLAGAWIVLISSAIIISNTQERDYYDEPARTGFALIDEGLQFLDSISQSGFSPIDFLSVGYWSIYVTIFLASLGAIGGLLQLYGKIRGISKKDFSAEKRQNVLLLSCAVVCSVILGTTAVLSSVRKRYLLQKFYVLEVHLVRFEGLMFNSFAISANHELLDTFFKYMIGYVSRIRLLLRDISRAYDFTDEEEIIRRMEAFPDAVKKLKARGYVVKDEIGDPAYGDAQGDETLLVLLNDLEFMQENVRRNIRQLER